MRDIAEDAGFFGRNTMLDHAAEDAAHDAIDIGGSGQFAGSENQFFGESLVEGIGVRRWEGAWRRERSSVLKMGGTELRVLRADGVTATGTAREAVHAAGVTGGKRRRRESG